MKPASVQFEVVKMENVPNPPSHSRSGGGKYQPLWDQIKTLPKGETHAVKVACSGKKELYYMRGQLREKAKRNGLRLLSSRTADDRTAYFWLQDDAKK